MAFLSAFENLFLFSVFVFFLGSHSGITAPLVPAIIPEIFKRNRIRTMNYWFQMGVRFSSILGNLCAGYLAFNKQYFLAFFIDSLSFFISGGLLAWTLKSNIPFETASVADNKDTNYRECFQFLLSDKAFLWSFLLVFIINLSFTPIHNLLTFEVKRLGWDEKTLGLIFSAYGAGAFIAPLIFLSSRMKKISLLVTIWSITIFYGIFVSQISLLTLLCAIFGLGLMSIPLLVECRSFLQYRTPPSLTGRTMALYNMQLMMAKPVGLFLGGIYTLVWSPASFFNAMAILLIITSGTFSAVSLIGRLGKQASTIK